MKISNEKSTTTKWYFELRIKNSHSQETENCMPMVFFKYAQGPGRFWAQAEPSRFLPLTAPLFLFPEASCRLILGQRCGQSWAEVAFCPVVSGLSAFLGVQHSLPQNLGAGFPIAFNSIIPCLYFLGDITEKLMYIPLICSTLSSTEYNLDVSIYLTASINIG